MNTRQPGRRLSLFALVLLVLAGCAPRPPEPQAPPPPPDAEVPATPAPEPAPTPAPPEEPPADPAADARSDPHVLMISFDGMRYDFLDRVPTPAFDRVAAEGVRAAGLIPVYPSKTFPNHYTLATGLYPAHHGIVDNVFYDPLFDATYALGDRETVEDGRWYGGEPIWKTAERQGLTAASFFWVGSEAEGLHPTYWKIYDGDVPNEARVDTVLAWLELPSERRPRVIMLYFSDVDASAHRYGPGAPQVDTAIAAMDALLGSLLDGLDRVAVGDRVNLILVSDHGMSHVPEDNVVLLDDYADLSDVRVVDNATQTFLYFDGDEAMVWATFDALKDRVPHAQVHLRDELPHRWRYRDSRRVGEIVVTAEPGWLVGSARSRRWRGGGMHGWDPRFRPMHGIFLAAGPGVRGGPELEALEAFESIHVHPFAAALLGIDPAPGIDGSLDILAPYVATPRADR